MLFKNRFRLYFVGLAAIMMCLLGLVWLEHTVNDNRNRQLSTAHRHMQQLVIDKQLDFLNIYQSHLQDTANVKRKWSDLYDAAQRKNISIQLLRNDTLELWTDNILDASQLRTLKDTFGFLQSPNAYTLAYQIKRGSYTFILSYIIKTNYAFRNQYIQNRFNDELSFIKDAVISSKPLDNAVAITGLQGQTLFYIQLFSFTHQTPVWVVILLLLLSFALLICIHILMRHYIRIYFVSCTLLFIAFWILVRWLNTFYHLPDFLYQLRLFNPLVYASSVWFPSLGDLLINSALVLWYFVLLESGKKRLHSHTSLNNTLRAVVWFILSVLSAHLAVVSIKSLSIDSQISFDIHNVFTINFFTYVGLIIIVIQLMVVYFIVRNFSRSLRPFKKQSTWWLYFYIIFGLIAYTAISYQFVHYTAFQLFITILLFISFFIFKTIPLKQNRFQQYFVVIFIISMVSSLAIHHWVRLKEQENRKLFAVKLISQNDITTDYFLRNVEKKISSDAYVKNYFQNPLITKTQFEKRIRQLYFTGYLSKFEVNVLDYDSMGYHFRQRNNYTYRQTNRLYEKETQETINTHFRYIKNSAETKGYVAKFYVREGKQLLGVLFILLKPKLIQDENRFDDLLIEGMRPNKKNDKGYSYAVYKNRSLIYQSGDYPYRIRNTWGDGDNQFVFFKENNFDHLLYTDDQPLTVVVSKPQDSLLQAIGLFSFIFTCCTITLILVLFVYVGLNAQATMQYKWLYKNIVSRIQFAFNKLMLVNQPDALYIRTRIQTSIIFILFITLSFTSYFTINFITQKYNGRQTERLMKKLRNVVLTIENEDIKSFDWKNSNELEAFINQIADFYDTDITLFDKHGKVIASSISKIYDEGIVSRLMPSMAYYHLKLLQESQFTQDEKVATLQFQAAYAPVFKNKTEVLGYLQLPYFSQKADLLSEISSIVVGFINLYVVLFIIIGIIAYLVSRNISYPLTLIQKRLSRTVLIGKNEPIIWQRDDEIGELVKQYNSMILQLEESAKKLAETEREGAWREIARQVAHEIKNPLTPMKLSIQHLQRAFKNNDPNIADKVNRTTQLLITQIDTLSELATEFSSFAKMPAPVYEHINVCHLLQQIKDLYSLNTAAKIEFNCHVASELFFDTSYLNRIVGNLVKNAIQAIPDENEGHIWIEAYENNENIIISVRDNGTGMTEEQADKIFLPYFSTKISGMGLGLTIVKNMVESGKGTIDFKTTLHKGTTFTVKLPREI